MGLWVFGWVLLACLAQPDLPPETILLSKVKARVAANLKQLPNFTCVETIRRSMWYKSTATPEMVDTVRLEVAFVNGKELYGWPGASRIDESDITKLAGGSVGNGYFALFLNNIFLVSSTTFHYAGPATLAGREMVRYNYVVPQLAHAYRLRSSRGAATVGYHGSFWIAKGGVDPLHIEVVADDVPADLGYSAARSTLDYAPVVVGTQTFVLPKTAEFVFTDTLGTQHRSTLSFQSCHEFVGEAAIKFVVPETRGVPLPDDFIVELKLDTPIDSANAAGGDAVHATLLGEIALRDGTSIPKGATITGRIAHITKNGAVYSLDFAFESLDFEGGHADLKERDNEVSFENWQKIRRTDHLNVPAGTRLTLKSRIRSEK